MEEKEILNEFLKKLKFLDKLNQEEKNTLERLLAIKFREFRNLADALDEVEERHKKLLDSTPHAVAIHCEGKLMYVNNAAVKLFKEENAENMLGKDIFSFVHKEYHETVRDRIKMQEKGESVPLIEEKFIDKNGNVLDVEVASSPVTYKGKKAFQAVFRDISQKKETEISLKETRELYKNLFQNSRDAIYISTIDGKFIDFNDAMPLMLGYEREELQNIDIKNLYVKAEDRENFKKLIKERGFVSKYEVELKKKDGTKIIAELTSQVVRNFKGKAIGYQGIIRDITEYKEAERKLRESEEKNRSILEAIPDLIFYFDKDGKFLSFKTSNLEELLVSPEEFIGKNAKEVLPPFLADMTIGKIKKTLGTKKVQSYEYELDIRSKHMYFEARMSVCGEDGVVAIVRNITDKKIAEEEKKKAEENLYIQATRDSLTNFYNEYEFDKIMRKHYEN